MIFVLLGEFFAHSPSIVLLEFLYHIEAFLLSAEHVILFLNMIQTQTEIIDFRLVAYTLHVLDPEGKKKIQACIYMKVEG
jgi:hypothetical protein